MPFTVSVGRGVRTMSSIAHSTSKIFQLSMENMLLVVCRQNADIADTLASAGEYN